MRSIVVPTASGAGVAATSLLFYVLFDHALGAALLGKVVLLQSAAAILQLAVVPQSWLYVMSSGSDEELERRYALSMAIEAAAGLAGLVAALALAFSPFDIARSNGWEFVLMYAGLWAAGSTSHQGFLRARAAWGRYALFILAPSALRLGLIGAVAAGGAPPSWVGDHRVVVAALFFAPDALRLAVAAGIGWLRYGRRFERGELGAALKGIGHNWLFDLGSGITENGDKLLVGALVGQRTLVTYFFARRIGNAITIAIEPLYAELYRRMLLAAPGERTRRSTAAYLIGAGVAGATAAAVAAVILVALAVPALRAYVPESVAGSPGVFFPLLLIDAGVSVNRWCRYLFHQGAASSVLLLVRLALRGLFGLVLAWLAAPDAPHAIVTAYLVMLCCETAFTVTALGRRRDGRGATRAEEAVAGDAAAPARTSG